jgi:hypothetical protein
MPMMGMNTALFEAKEMLKAFCKVMDSMSVGKNVQQRTQNLFCQIVYDEIIIFYQSCRRNSSLVSNTDEALKQMIDEVFWTFIFPMLTSHVVLHAPIIEDPQQIMLNRYRKVFQWFTKKKRVVINLHNNTITIVPRYVEQYL